MFCTSLGSDLHLALQLIEGFNKEKLLVTFLELVRSFSRMVPTIFWSIAFLESIFDTTKIFHNSYLLFRSYNKSRSGDSRNRFVKM